MQALLAKFPFPRGCNYVRSNYCVDLASCLCEHRSFSWMDLHFPWWWCHSVAVAVGQICCHQPALVFCFSACLLLGSNFFFNWKNQMNIFLLPSKAVLMVSNVCVSLLVRNYGNTAQCTNFLWLFFLITPLILKCRFVAKYTRVYLIKIWSNEIVIVIHV